VKITKDKRIRSFACLLGSTSLAFVTGCSPAPVPVAHAANDPSSPSAPTGTYVCPMHPEVTSTAPGVCPKCNMKLVPKK